MPCPTSDPLRAVCAQASFILGAGERGKRLALPHSRVMIHQPMGGSQGQAEDIRIEAEQILKIKGTLVTMYSQMTGQTRERVIQALDRDNYMSAQQALEFGLIDKIVTNVNEPSINNNPGGYSVGLGAPDL